MPPDTQPSYHGQYTIDGAQLFTIPTLGPDGTIDWFADPPGTSGPETPEKAGLKRSASASMPINWAPAAKRRVPGTVTPPAPRPVGAPAPPAAAPPAPAPPAAPPPAPAPPALPTVSSLAVLDVGQANWNMLIDGATHEPVLYFDCGRPLNLYRGSMPPSLQYWNPATYEGPILQNTAGTLRVMLSHWDFDHWGFAGVRPPPGRVNPLRTFHWTVPNQAIGPAGHKFFDSIPAANRSTHPPNVSETAIFSNARIYQCKPRPGAAHDVMMNNSGLALGVLIDFGGPQAEWVISTGDANFPTLPNWPLVNVSGIVAVHHGSGHHGAADRPNIPEFLGGRGRIAYSYGVDHGGMRRCYNHPSESAIANYRARNWMNEVSTVEGPQIHDHLPPNPVLRGNIRMGDQTALQNAGGTAFNLFPYALT